MVRFGGGATYHLGGKVRGTGSLDDYERDFDNSLGFTGEVSMVRGSFTAGVRYTPMDVTVDGFSVPLDGSSLGLFVGITTPRK